MSWQGQNGVKCRRGAYINLLFSSIPRTLSPFQIPHGFGKTLNTYSPQRQPPLMSLLPTSVLILMNLQLDNTLPSLSVAILLFLYSSLFQSPKFVHHYWLLLAGVQHVHLVTPPRRRSSLSLYWGLLQIHVIMSARNLAWHLILRLSPRLALSESSKTVIITSVLLLGQEYIKTEIKIT